MGGQLAGDLWTTLSPLEAAEDNAKEVMYRKYAHSRVDRALKRTVVPYKNRPAYSVRGEPSWGDAYDSYIVTYDSGTNRYACTCHQSKGGEYRSRGRYMCTHVIAVDYHRTVERFRGNLDVEDTGPEAVSNDVNVAAPTISNVRPTDVYKHERPSTNTVSIETNIDPNTASEALPSLQDPEWGPVPFPPKFQQLRSHQWLAVQEIVSALRDPNIKAVFLDAPTGSGKTLIGECVRRLMNLPTVYLCTTKQLQQQFIDDFPYAKLLQGRSNYPTQNYPDRFRPGDDHPLSDSITAADCAKRKIPITCAEANCSDPYCEGGHWKWVCPLCDNPAMCAYTLAKQTALRADLAILNTAYYLAEANGPGEFSRRKLIILDEADNIERSLLNYVEISISASIRKRLDIGMPAKKTVPKTWQVWIEGECLPAVEKALKESQAKLRMLKGDARIKEARWHRRLARLKDQLEGCSVADGSWVYTGYKGANPTVIFKPIKVDEFGPKLLWDHSEKWLLMSATFIDPYGMAEDLGLPASNIQIVQMPSSFPAERRPVYIIPRANMGYKSYEEEVPRMIQAVQDVMNAYPDERILVHSVSYKLTNALISGLNSKRIMSYARAAERDMVLDKFRQTPGAVLIAPSLDRGVDLPDDECRVVVVAKIPFPDLSDKQTSARLYSKGGSRWYASSTIRTICQMTGRAMRSADDYCDIYILDRQFVSNLWKNKRLMPKWWRDAVIMSGSPKVKF